MSSSDSKDPSLTPPETPDDEDISDLPSDDDSSDDDTSEEIEDEDSTSEEEEDAADEASAAAQDAAPEVAGPDPRLYAVDRAFTDFPLSPEILQGLAELGYKLPTRVQAMTLEPGLAGKDLVVRSKTGTGKTTAFCLPMVERIPAGIRQVSAIVLTPTRELAVQVAQECTALAKYKDIRVTAIYGGVGFGPQEDALRDGAEIVVGTPGRILDHIRRGNLNLGTIRFACLDEADEMLSMGFFEDVKKILDATPKDRQILLFSATVDDKVKSLIRMYARTPDELLLSTDADRVEGITHVLYETTPDFHKARALLALLDIEQPRSAIIFANTREDASTVTAFLSRQGLDAELISGELPQAKREKVMAAVKRGEVQFLVATDVAARGIDISDLSHVINYSLPEDPAIYLHRTGRTGRIGKTGIAISLAGGMDMHTRSALTKQYSIEFVVKPLPSPAEADRSRVERQVKAIQRAMGTMAFEGYLGTVRAIRERPDADMLFAAALRAFFLYDRMRKAADEVGPEADGSEPREERRERRDSRDGRGERRDSRDSRGRSDRGDRGDRGGRGERRDGGRGERSGPRSDSRSEPRSDARSEPRSDARPEPRAEGRWEGRGERKPAREASPEAVVAPVVDAVQPPEGAEGVDARKKRRRRRRRGGKGGEGGEGGPEADGTSHDVGGESGESGDQE